MSLLCIHLSDVIFIFVQYEAVNHSEFEFDMRWIEKYLLMYISIQGLNGGVGVGRGLSGDGDGVDG